MKSARRKTKPFTSLRETLVQSFEELPAPTAQSLEYCQLCWNLAAGSDLAARSRVERVSRKTLYLRTTGPEWLAAIKSLESKLLKALNEFPGLREITRIRLETGGVFGVQPAPDAKKVEKLTSPRPAKRDRLNQTELNESLKMIPDESLKQIVSRVGKKIAVLSLLVLASVALPNCATAPAPVTLVEEPRAVSMDQSIAVKKVAEIQSRDPNSKIKDPRSYYHYLMSLKAEHQRDFRGAARELSLVNRHDPKTEKFYPKLSRLLLRTGQVDDALEIAEKGLERFPENEKLALVRADLLEAQDRPQEALAAYDAILAQDSRNSRAGLLSGVLLLNSGNKSAALERFQTLTRQELNNPLGFYYLGRTYIELDENEKAAANFQKTLKLRPNFLDAREHLAWVLEKLGRNEAAAKEFSIILKLNPGNQKIKEYLKQIHANPNQASGFGAELLEDSNVHLKIGAILYEQSAYLGALDEFRLIVYKNEGEDIRIIIAKIYEFLERYDEAVEELEALMASKPESIGLLLQTARLHTINDHPKRAIQLLERASRLEPKNDRLYHSLALAHMSLAENETAVDYMERAIEINPSKDAYYFEKGALLEKIGEIDGAIENMKKTIEINPIHSNAHNFLGYIYALQGVYLSEAVEHLKRALAVQPRNGYFLDSLGWVYFKKGEPEKALTQIKKALIYAPPDPILYDHLGDVHFELQNYQEARKAWNASLSLTVMKEGQPNVELPDRETLEQKLEKVTKHLQTAL